MVVAVANHGVMGNAGALPWRLSHDLQRFKRLTMGHAMLMGRKTFESIGRVLPGRETIILSRQSDYRAEGARVVTGIDEALALIRPPTHAFVVGGAEIYRAAWPRVGVLHLTRVHAKILGDTLLDPLDLTDFQCVEQEHVPADTKNDWPSDYQAWMRRTPPSQS